MGNTVPFPGQGSPNGWLCRSTKSASKARRDQINAELHALRSLLPISTQEKERLSYLHTMALVCLRLRGAHLFPPGTHRHYCSFPIGAALLCTGHCSCAFQNSASHCAHPAASAPPSGPVLAAELLSLLPGFLLVLSAGGKLVYISENVSQFLGLSMVRAGQCGFALFPCAHCAQHTVPVRGTHVVSEGYEVAVCQHTARWGRGPAVTAPSIRWSFLPTGTPSSTSWMGKHGRTCTRSSFSPRSSQAGVSLGRTGVQCAH